MDGKQKGLTAGIISESAIPSGRGGGALFACMMRFELCLVIHSVGDSRQ